MMISQLMDQNYYLKSILKIKKLDIFLINRLKKILPAIDAKNSYYNLIKKVKVNIFFY